LLQGQVGANLTGQPIRQQSVQSYGDTKLSLDLSAHPAGIHHLQLLIDGTMRTEKLLLQ
jgi:hypothetical protein